VAETRKENGGGVRESGHNPGVKCDPWKRFLNFCSQLDSEQAFRVWNLLG